MIGNDPAQATELAKPPCSAFPLLPTEAEDATSEMSDMSWEFSTLDPGLP